MTLAFDDSPERGRPSDAPSVRAAPAELDVRDDEVVLPALPAGTFHLDAQVEEGRFGARFTIRAGEETPVDLKKEE